MKNLFWKVLGFLSLGMAYVGLVTPGIPYSIFVVFAAYCFAKGSPRMHKWIYNHKIFGTFLINWETKRIFPTKMKYFMICMMSSSLIIMWYTSVNTILMLSTAAVMLMAAVWAWQFPGSAEAWKLRKDNGEKSMWIK
jgi:uncharacterized membrane protein YbaN (DUF454 family)